MRIKRKFIQLTKKTYPYGTEEQLKDHLPRGYKKDEFGNYFLQIGHNPTTMFTCHLDTASKSQVNVKHVFQDGLVMTDGTTILGADDKAGMVVILYMIYKKVPGLYYFFIGEEDGCIGSKNVRRLIDKNIWTSEALKSITKCVSFDRRGTSSVITEQLYCDCCSYDFARELVARFNSTDKRLSMKADFTGYSTDSAQFMDIISECTNISVGYTGEHTVNEKQDLDFLVTLCHTVVKIDWESLPVKRTPRSSDWYYGSYKDYDYRDWESPYDAKFDITIKNAEYSKNYYAFLMDPMSGMRKKAYISKIWVTHEEYLIHKGLLEKGHAVEKVKWDGTSCIIKNTDTRIDYYFGSRRDVAKYLYNGGEIPSCHYLFEDDDRLRHDNHLSIDLPF